MRPDGQSVWVCRLRRFTDLVLGLGIAPLGLVGVQRRTPGRFNDLVLGLGIAPATGRPALPLSPPGFNVLVLGLGIAPVIAEQYEDARSFQ